ncbi:hypothetical protein N7471_008178 [Penicillium samsonianum]|uniref:uncharacterized protein n=1 Tax=Penicillium samsonianum TaxID=1882272 RepID=UPI002548FF40|nr:uncharacterized protein N7471_008178 [Penicillium samsonianum]KAJ6132963.1 hypothetical protein N7471_008178 [Penicillium samsonianum]
MGKRETSPKAKPETKASLKEALKGLTNSDLACAPKDQATYEKHNVRSHPELAGNPIEDAFKANVPDKGIPAFHQLLSMEFGKLKST